MNLKIPGTIFLFIPFLNIKKSVLTNLKTPLFIPIIITILKGTIYIKTIIQIIYIKKFIQIDKHNVKYIITACTHKLLSKKFYFFCLLYIRINGKNINFNDEKIKKATSTTKTKKIFNIDDIDANKILIS